MTLYLSDQISSNPDALVPSYVGSPGLGDSKVQSYISVFDLYPFPGPDNHTHGSDLQPTALAPEDVIVLFPVWTQSRILQMWIRSSDDTDSPLSAGGGWNAVATPAALDCYCGLYERTPAGALGPVVDINFFSGAAKNTIRTWDQGGSNWLGNHVFGETLARLDPMQYHYGAGSENENHPMYAAMEIETISGITKGGRIVVTTLVKGA